jgi:eukaryotic-like serine/threonine-protein kinase
MDQAEQGEEAVFEAALQLPADQRGAYLDKTCAGDPETRRRVEGLLGAFERAGGFLKEPAVPGPARTVAVSLPPTEKPGDRIGRYKLLEQIGEGGCGVVYVAEQEAPVHRRVALKVIKLGMDTRQVIARFEAERQALALMDHPNIARILDAGATETGRPYFVMELVRGTKITDYCDQNQLSPRARLDLFTQVCRAIQHAHQKGVIHRDIKPSNILVTLHDGLPVPKVIDFGIAKATQGRLTDQTVYTAFVQFIGTPAYMSPEQAEMSGLDIDTRSDIYSLGVLLYELLTGQTPFDTKELMAAGLDAMRRTIREQEPPRPSTVVERLSKLRVERDGASGPQGRSILNSQLKPLSIDLDWIVMKCLEKDRVRRYETANGLAADIQRHLDNEPVNARPAGRFYRLQKSVRRNKAAFAATAAVALVLVIGVVVSTAQAVRARRAEREQTRLREIAQTKEKKSEQVAQFLQDMLKGVGPSVALGRDTTMLREILDKTAERIGQDLTNQPEVEVELGLTLAATYHDLALFKSMERVARKTLLVAQAKLGVENESVAASLIALGDALQHMGSIEPEKLEESEKLNREGLAMSRKLFGNENPTVANALTHLGNVIETRGRHAEAETVLGEALAMSRKLFGNEDLKVARLLIDLAIVMASQVRLTEAETLSREALSMQRKLLGEHPDVAKSLYVLANALFGQAKLAEAERRYREALAMLRELHANDRGEGINARSELGLVLMWQDKLAEAETTEREALEMARRLGSNENEYVAWVLSNLAFILTKEGKLPEAEANYRDAFAMRRKLLGNEHAVVAGSLFQLADVLLRERKFDEVEPLFNDILTPAFQTQPKSADLLRWRGNCRARMGHWKEAAADFSRLVKFDPKNQDAYHALAALLAQSGDFQGYRLHCAQELACFTGTSDPNTAERLAKDCLILPDSGVDLNVAAPWAHTAVTKGKDSDDLPWFQFCTGLAEYRQQHFAAAVDWVQKALTHAGAIPNRDVEAYMVLAMAKHRSNQADEAGATLARGVAIAERQLPKLDSGDLEDGWLDWIIAHALMREAKGLIDGMPVTAPETKS